MRRFLCVCVLSLLVSSCSGSRGASGRLLDSANDFNLATMFGRMDLALEHAAPISRESLLARRKLWGSEIRVVDVSVTGVKMSDEEHADVLVQVAWTRMSDSVLRNTSVQQSWENPKLNGWVLQRELRVGGDAGLFGEAPPVVFETAPPRDVHFPSRSLGTTP